jgi:hypothetical protein
MRVKFSYQVIFFKFKLFVQPVKSNIVLVSTQLVFMVNPLSRLLPD